MPGSEQERESRRLAQPESATRRDVALHQQELLHLLRWFIRVRWLFVAGLAAIFAGGLVFHLALPLTDVAVVGLTVLTYNILFYLFHDDPPGAPLRDLGACRAEAALQIGLDLVALTVVVHLAGGAHSPFPASYVFHAIVGSVLLPKRDAWLVGLAGFALFTAVVVLEQQGIVPHYDPVVGPVDHRPQDLRLLVGTSLVSLVTIAGTISIASSIMNNLRRREHQLVSTQHAPHVSQNPEPLKLIAAQ